MIFLVHFRYQKSLKNDQKMKRTNDENEREFESSEYQKPSKNIRKINENQKMSSAYFYTKIIKK